MDDEDSDCDEEQHGNDVEQQTDEVLPAASA